MVIRGEERTDVGLVVAPYLRVLLAIARKHPERLEEEATMAPEGTQQRVPPPLASTSVPSDVNGRDGNDDKVSDLQRKIEEVEVQAAIRTVQVKILEVKIRQVELMVLLKQAQQVVDLRSRESLLIAKKRELEQKIHELEERIAHAGPPAASSHPTASAVLAESAALLSNLAHLRERSPQASSSSSETPVPPPLLPSSSSRIPTTRPRLAPLSISRLHPSGDGNDDGNDDKDGNDDH